MPCPKPIVVPISLFLRACRLYLYLLLVVISIPHTPSMLRRDVVLPLDSIMYQSVTPGGRGGGLCTIAATGVPVPVACSSYCVWCTKEHTCELDYQQVVSLLCCILQLHIVLIWMTITIYPSAGRCHNNGMHCRNRTGHCKYGWSRGQCPAANA